MNRIIAHGTVTLVLTTMGLMAIAQENESDNSAAAIAEKLANPNAVMGFLSFPIDFVSYVGDTVGAGSESAWKVNFQPSFPYPLGEGTNLFIRPLIPLVIDQPVPLVADAPVLPLSGSSNFSGSGLNLADISFDVAVGKTFPSKLVLLGGVVGTLPTATDDALGLDQYLLGPEFYVGKVTDWGSVGVLLSHQWDVAGADDFTTSVTGG